FKCPPLLHPRAGFRNRRSPRVAPPPATHASVYFRAKEVIPSIRVEEKARPKGNRTVCTKTNHAFNGRCPGGRRTSSAKPSNWIPGRERLIAHCARSFPRRWAKSTKSMSPLRHQLNHPVKGHRRRSKHERIRR